MKIGRASEEASQNGIDPYALKASENTQAQ